MRNAMILNSNYAKMAIVGVLAASALYGEAAANEFSEFVWADEPVSIDTSAQDRIVPSSVAIAYDPAWFNLADGVQLRLVQRGTVPSEFLPGYATQRVLRWLLEGGSDNI